MAQKLAVRPGTGAGAAGRSWRAGRFCVGAPGGADHSRRACADQPMMVTRCLTMSSSTAAITQISASHPEAVC